MLYQFKIELSNVDENLYESLDFRVAQHPSETSPYLLTRTLAFILNHREGLEFSASGLGNPDDPAILVKGMNGATELWIEIGNPSIRKLHRASKASEQVKVYTYKNTEVFLREIKDQEVHRASKIEIFSLDPKFLASLEKALVKNNRWQVLFQQGQIDIGTEKATFSSEIKRLKVKD